MPRENVQLFYELKVILILQNMLEIYFLFEIVNT